MHAPSFWYLPEGQKTKCPYTKTMLAVLKPAAFLNNYIGQWRRDRTKPAQAGCPVICVGNLTAGGTGKTPVALDLGERLQAMGKKPFFLLRGYGGSESGPLIVDVDRHHAAQVGDEALLLAAQAPTVISRNRPKGAALARAQGADVIVMDDGFQNPSLKQDIAFVVVDAETGFGNGRLIPAGPLRENVAPALARADAIILMGPQGDATIAPQLMTYLLESSRPILQARLNADAPPLETQRRAIVFAGIGRPTKVLATAQAQGYEIADALAYADHHPYTDKDWKELTRMAEEHKAILLTTEKDAVRLTPEQRAHVEVIAVHVDFESDDEINALLHKALSRNNSLAVTG